MTSKPPPGAPTAPIEIAGGAASATGHLSATRVEVPDAVITRLGSVCETVTTDPATLAEASRDCNGPARDRFSRGYWWF